MANDKKQEAQELAAVLQIGIEDTGVKGALQQERENWLNRHRGAVVTNKVTFYHSITERAYRRDFEKMSQYLYFIPVFGRILLKGAHAKELSKIEKHVHDALMKHIRHLDHRIRECNLAFQRAAADVPSSFSGGTTVDVPLTSPMSRLYLELMTRADTFLNLVGHLWISGLLDDEFELNERKRTDYELEIKRIFKTIDFSIINQHRAIINRLRRQEREARGGAKGATKEVDAAAVSTEDNGATDAVPVEPVKEAAKEAPATKTKKVADKATAANAPAAVAA
jgi:hypothetical protein